MEYSETKNVIDMQYIFMLYKRCAIDAGQFKSTWPRSKCSAVRRNGKYFISVKSDNNNDNNNKMIVIQFNLLLHSRDTSRNVTIEPGPCTPRIRLCAAHPDT